MFEPVSSKKVQEVSDYIDTDSDIANYLSYNFEGRWMYIAGLKVFEEFGTADEGSVTISEDGNYHSIHLNRCAELQ